MPISRVASSSRYAPAIGLSAAVQRGDLVFVAGTSAMDGSGAIVGGGDPYAQTQEVLRKISAVPAEVVVVAGLLDQRTSRARTRCRPRW